MRPDTPYRVVWCDHQTGHTGTSVVVSRTEAETWVCAASQTVPHWPHWIGPVEGNDTTQDA